MSIGLPQFSMDDLATIMELLPTADITHVRLNNFIHHRCPRLLPHRDNLIRNIMPIILRHKRPGTGSFNGKTTFYPFQCRKKWSGNAW